MQFFRLLNRRTRSESDVSILLSQPAPVGLTAPVFVPLQGSLPSFDPTRELYALPTDSVQAPMDSDPMIKLNARVIELEAQLIHLQDGRSTLEQDLVDYRADLLHTRTELYSEMLRSARHQQRAMDNFGTIQKLEARHQRFCSLLVDIGIPRSTVDVICQAIQSGHGSPDEILVDAIRDASNTNTTLLARLKPVIMAERTPEHYQSALNLTLSIRKDLKSQKKKTKFWKKLAQEDDRHASIITPSPSDISSIRQDLSPEKQGALNALIARRRTTKYLDNTENDVFGGQRTGSALDTLACSLASRPRCSIQDDSRLSSFSSSSASTTYHSYLSGLSRIPKDSAAETPTMQSRLPSTLSTSLRRSTGSSSQSIVLSNINLNVSRSSSIDPSFPEEPEPHTNSEIGPVSTVTVSQDLLQNVRCASQGHGHRRIPSTASRRLARTRSTCSSFRLSAFSPIRACRSTGLPTAPDSDVSGNTAIDTPLFHTPDAMTRLPDLMTSTVTDTPGSSEVTSSDNTPFNDAHVLAKYGIDTPSDGSAGSKPLSEDVCAHGTRFLEHVDLSMSVTMSTSTSVAASESSVNAEDGHEDGCNHARMDANTSTIPLGESNDSLFTTSTSASASAFSSHTANDTSAPPTPPTPCPSPAPSPGLCTTPSNCAGTGTTSVRRSMLPVLVKHLRRLSLSGTSPERERVMSRLRGLGSLSMSKSRSGSGLGLGPGSPFTSTTWRGSPVRSESGRSEHFRFSTGSSPSPSAAKGSGIPVLQRRMTIRARRTSVRKV